MNDFMIRMKYIITPLSVLILIFFLSDNLKAADKPVTEESGNERQQPATETLGEKRTILPPISEGQTIDNPANLSPFERGVTEFNDENYEEALVLFEEAYKGIQTDPQITRYLALTHREMQNFPEAVRFFKETISLDRRAGDSSFLLADVLYNSREYEEALTVVDTALGEGIRLPESNHLKGQILTKLKRNSEAIEAFKKAKSLDPMLSQPADFQIALVYLDEKKFKKAEEVLNGLITIDPTSDWAVFSKEYLEAILRIRPPYRLTLSAGIQYDDNVLAVPIDQSLIGIKKQGDWKGIFSLFGEYTIYEGKTWSTRASYSINATKHRQSSYPKDNGGVVFSQDTINHTFSIMPSHGTTSGVSAINLSYSYLEIASVPYMFTFAVNPSYTFIINDNQLGQLSLKYKKQDQDQEFFQRKFGSHTAREEERGADNYSGGVGYIYKFAKGNGLVNMRLEGELNDDEHGSNWAYRGVRWSGGLLYPFSNNRVRANLYLEVYNQAFSNINSIYGMRRNDTTTILEPSLTYAVTRSLDLNMEYAYINDYSNISVYRYIKNLYTGKVVFRF